MDRGKYRGIVLTCVLRAACALGLANTYVQEAQPESPGRGVANQHAMLLGNLKPCK